MGENVVIPFISVATAIISWLIYLTMKIQANEKSIELNNANDKMVNNELQRIYNMLEKFEIKVDSSIDKLDRKIDSGIGKLEIKIDRLINRRHDDDEE